jgi:hypothetical protein
MHCRARHDQWNDEDEGDDGEAESKPRAQGHVQCGFVQVLERGAGVPPS